MLVNILEINFNNLVYLKLQFELYTLNNTLKREQNSLIFVGNVSRLSLSNHFKDVARSTNKVIKQPAKCSIKITIYIIFRPLCYLSY